MSNLNFGRLRLSEHVTARAVTGCANTPITFFLQLNHYEVSTGELAQTIPLNPTRGSTLYGMRVPQKLGRTAELGPNCQIYAASSLSLFPDFPAEIST